MSPNDNERTPHQQTPARGIAEVEMHALNVVNELFEPREETRSVSGASEAPLSACRISNASSERMDRLEGLLAGMAQQQAQFISNQLKIQEQLSHRAEAAHTTPSERSKSGSGAFTKFIRARDRRMRRGSLDEPMQNALPTTPRMPPPPQTPKASLYFVLADDHGLKLLKPGTWTGPALPSLRVKRHTQEWAPTSRLGECVLTETWRSSANEWR